MRSCFLNPVSPTFGRRPCSHPLYKAPSSPVATPVFYPQRKSAYRYAQLAQNQSHISIASLQAPGSRFASQRLLTRLTTSLIFNLTSYILSLQTGIVTRLLTPTALIHAAILGTIIYTAFGLPGWILTAFFLAIGSIVTKLGIVEKKKKGMADSARNVAQVWGAGGAAAACAVLGLSGVIGLRLARIGFVGAMATKCMDTVSSEIGKAYGGTTVVLPSLKVVEKGTEGGVSIVGTLAGVLGAIMAGFLAFGGGLVSNVGSVGIAVAAAVVGTTVESWIGANVQEKLKLSNEFVNFINTSVGAVAAILLFSLRVG